MLRDRRPPACTCDAAARDARIAAAEAKLRDAARRREGPSLRGANLTPDQLGHGSACPVPCADASIALRHERPRRRARCASPRARRRSARRARTASRRRRCRATAPAGRAGDRAREDRQGVVQLASRWTAALARCEDDNADGDNVPPLDCSTDPDGGSRARRRSGRARSRTAPASPASTGAPSAGNAAATQACIEGPPLAPIAPGFTDVAYP